MSSTSNISPKSHNRCVPIANTILILAVRTYMCSYTYATYSTIRLNIFFLRYCIEKMHGVTVAVDCLERCNRRLQVM